MMRWVCLRSSLGYAGVVAALIGISLVGPAGATGSTGTQPTYVPNEYIVNTYKGASIADVEQSVARMGATLVQKLPLPDTYLIRMGATRVTSRAAKSGSGSGVFTTAATRWVITTVEPNIIVYPSSVEPNDEFWPKMWDMQMIGMPRAWDIEKGSSAVVVAVADTGVAPHPDLVDRLLPGYDFIDNDADANPAEADPHGTHVAGTVAAQGGNQMGVCGVCWDGVKILPVRVLGPAGGSTAQIINGLYYAMEQGADVVNMSLGPRVGGLKSPAMRRALNVLSSSGIILVAAAGNNSTDLSAPAVYDECIAVASVGPTEAIASYSSFGPGNEVDIAAPGGEAGNPVNEDDCIWSTVVDWDDKGQMLFSYGGAPWQGTSMAAPHVAGAAALLLSRGVPPRVVRSRLINTARAPLGGLEPIKFGAGILDVYAALANASVKIVTPGKGETVSSEPQFKILVGDVELSTIKVYLDYPDADGNGTPDDPTEGIVMDGSTCAAYLNSARTALEFSWSNVSDESPTKTIEHRIYVSADPSVGGEAVSDWTAFSVSRLTVKKGIHMFAFPYALANRSIDTPAKLLPGAKFGFNDSPRSQLVRWIAAPRSTYDSTPVGYTSYSPTSSVDRVWNSPFFTMNDVSQLSGGGWYFDTLANRAISAYPAGAGFWLILPNDVNIDETYPSMDSLTTFDGSKGFEIPLYKGWNMIGNPYSHDVSWRAALVTYRGVTKTLVDAENAGWVRSMMYGYGDSSTGYVRVSDRDMLKPYNAYWLRALVGGASQSESLSLSILP